MTQYADILVERPIDRAAAEAILNHCGHQLATAYGSRGVNYIKKKLTAFSSSAKDIPLLAMVDFMDTQLPCPGKVVEEWAPNRTPICIVRIVVREIESWALADRNGIASFLKIDINKVPQDVEKLTDPKLSLINLARQSKSSNVKKYMAPEKDSTALVGKLYTSEMIRYFSTIWDIEAARENSDSLNRSIIALKNL